jgi:ribulose 1,5-bisphosphate carboxylase large subunit-like protein
MDRTTIWQRIKKKIAHFGITYTTHIFYHPQSGTFWKFIWYSMFSSKKCFTLSKFKILFLLKFIILQIWSSFLQALWVEDMHIFVAFWSPTQGIQVERNKLKNHGCPLIQCIITWKFGLSAKEHVWTLLFIIQRIMKTFEN